jgi:hypothetical protein
MTPLHQLNSNDRLADAIAKDIADLLEAANRCDDPDRLRIALSVLAGALPDLIVTVEPVEAIVATSSLALAGTWP